MASGQVFLLSKVSRPKTVWAGPPLRELGMRTVRTVRTVFLTSTIIARKAARSSLLAAILVCQTMHWDGFVVATAVLTAFFRPCLSDDLLLHGHQVRIPRQLGHEFAKSAGQRQWIHIFCCTGLQRQAQAQKLSPVSGGSVEKETFLVILAGTYHCNHICISKDVVPT